MRRIEVPEKLDTVRAVYNVHLAPLVLHAKVGKQQPDLVAVPETRES